MAVLSLTKKALPGRLVGAYYGYETMLTAMGHTPSPLSAFPAETVSRDFYGTVYSKSGISWVQPDEIDVRTQQQPTTKIVNYSSGQPAETPMYDKSYLDKKDKYAMFMGGNTPLEVVTTGKTDGKKLLVLRDSYFDSVTPYLQKDFSELHIMDLRYYKTQAMEQSISDYIKQHGIDEVLICYSVATFGVVGSTDAGNCYFTYTQPGAANVASTISGLTISGC